VLALRYKQPGAREFRVPFNFKLGDVEIPVGLILTDYANSAGPLYDQSLHERDRHDFRHCVYSRVFCHIRGS